MSNEYGKNWRLAIGDGAVPEVFTPIGGETSLSFTRSSQEQDISDKDTGIYGASSYGQQKIAFKVSGNLKLPDAGLEAVIDASKDNPPEVMIQLKKGGIIKYHGKVAIGNLSTEFPTVGPATYSADMANAGVPIVDDLGAAA